MEAQFYPAGSPDAVAMARSMGIPEEIAHRASSAGLEAMQRQGEEARAKRARPGAFEHYVQIVVECYLRANGLVATPKAA
jgi:hypothetical protein